MNVQYPVVDRLSEGEPAQSASVILEMSIQSIQCVSSVEMLVARCCFFFFSSFPFLSFYFLFIFYMHHVCVCMWGNMYYKYYIYRGLDPYLM
jgi:hypothetical protein